MKPLFVFAAIIWSSSAMANAAAECAEPVGPDAALDAGVAAIYAAQSLASYSDVEGRSFQTILYHGIEDFLACNPGCCKFSTRGEDGFVPTPKWQKRNSFYGFVSANYKAYRVEDGDASNVRDVSVEVAITTCGKAIWYSVDDDDW